MLIDDSIRSALLPILPAAMDISKRHGLPSDYKSGHRPRHIAGNLADPEAVRTILLLAEPGSSPDYEELNRDEADWIDDICCDGVGGKGFRLRYDEKAQSLYKKNPRSFFAMIWPDESYAARMKKVIITNSFWMQAHLSGENVPAQAAKEFGVYLKQFVSAFPNAICVAAGGKAKERCKWANISAIGMGALTPPGANQPKIKESWSIAASEVKRRIKLA